MWVPTVIVLSRGRHMLYNIGMRQWRIENTSKTTWPVSDVCVASGNLCKLSFPLRETAEVTWDAGNESWRWLQRGAGGKVDIQPLPVISCLHVSIHNRMRIDRAIPPLDYGKGCKEHKLHLQWVELFFTLLSLTCPSYPLLLLFPLQIELAVNFGVKQFPLVMSRQESSELSPLYHCMGWCQDPRCAALHWAAVKGASPYH